MKCSRPAIISLILTGALAVSLVCLLPGRSRVEEQSVEVLPDHLKCVLEIDTLTSRAGELVTGYNYHILSRYAEDNGRDIEIKLEKPGHHFRDSLRAGAIDLLAVPFPDTLPQDSLLASTPADSLYLWLTREKDSSLMEEMNGWISGWEISEEHGEAKDKFLVNYSPYRISKSGDLSPYDAIVHEQADSTGNDWRLLSAIIYKESRFHIEAGSPRGARGLMQIKPSTALSMGVTDLADPEQNIKAGALYLNHLKRHFRKKTTSPEELMKFVLASYNAGMGRIDECIRYAESRGRDCSVWDSVATVIPEMSDSALVASGTLRYGKFNGTETISYVNTVQKLYDDFCWMYPE